MDIRSPLLPATRQSLPPMAVLRPVHQSRPGRLHFGAPERVALAGLYGCVALLHLIGFGTLFYYRHRYPALGGLAFAAYMFGLRHAFDADHIAAIDDTVRFAMQKGRRPLGIGFFFSLGHSTIVLLLAVAVAVAGAAIKHGMPMLKSAGAIIGTSVSGVFLWGIGILNLLVLLEILQIWRKARSGQHDHAHLEELLAQRGLLNRLFGGRLQKFVRQSWQMYPLGVLFGLGFDTASEVALLAMTAGAAVGNLPVAAVLSLPVLFAAGMTLMDTTDGVLMTNAYDWAFINPVRKIFYNLATTSLSVAVALVIGSIELLQVLIGLFGWRGRFFDGVAGLDFGTLGYVIVGIFLLVWAGSVAVWKFGKIEQKMALTHPAHSHEHVHASGVRHRHEHFH